MIKWPADGSSYVYMFYSFVGVHGPITTLFFVFVYFQGRGVLRTLLCFSRSGLFIYVCVSVDSENGGGKKTSHEGRRTFTISINVRCLWRHD